VNLSQLYLFIQQKIWLKSMTDSQRFATILQEMLSKSAQLDRLSPAKGKSEFPSLSKFALMLGSVLVAASGVIHLIPI
jgi:hypothetical protein